MTERIGAVVLAAGRSVRMGQPKMVLPWGTTTVIGQVVRVLKMCHIDPVVVVVGGAADNVVKALNGEDVIIVRNMDFEKSDMLLSCQLGILSFPEEVAAALICLGDQPQISQVVVNQIVNHYLKSERRVIIPSINMHRGHPWLVERSLWSDLLALQPEKNLRDFLNSHHLDISYVGVDSDSILKDLDTPDDYLAQAPPHL